MGRDRLRQPGLATLYTICGLFYILIGAIGASIVTGVACLIDGFGSIIGSTEVSMIGLPVYILLAPLWAFSIGIAILQGFGTDMVADTETGNGGVKEFRKLSELRS